MPLLSRLLRPSSALPRLIPQSRMSSSMAQRLAGKTILITGASSGIGKSVALEFARTQPHDLKLIVTARRFDALEQLAANIKEFASGVQVHPVKLDVSVPEEVAGLVDNLPEAFKEVDVLVNNACVSYPSTMPH